MRDDILQNIKNNLPKGDFPLPEIPVFNATEGLLDLFVSSVKSSGSSIEIIEDKKEIIELVLDKYPNAKHIVNTSKHIEHDSWSDGKTINPKELYPLDLAIISGKYGVAENAAIWVENPGESHRVVPFLCEDLIIILDKKELFADMHQVYQKIDLNESDFGVFIAGPSKTADIEQCLVIGAQGPRSMMVILY